VSTWKRLILRSSLVACWLTLPPSVSRAQIDFSAWRVYDVDPSPEFGPIAPGDFDGDGRPDFVAAASRSRLFVLRGDPGRGFVAMPFVAAPRSIGRLWPVDADGDGFLDVVVIAAGAEVLIYRGDGAGRLAPAGAAATGSGHGASLVADFDADGLADVGVVDSGQEIWLLLRGGPGGSLREPIRTTLPSDTLSAADLDEDGNLDVVASGPRTPSLAWFRGDGAFGFDGPRLIGTPTVVRAAVADLDGDGHVDIAEQKGVGTASSSLRIVRGDGSGAFALAAEFETGLFFDLAAVDIDEDGDLDLLAPPKSFLNDGSGGFDLGRTLPFDLPANMVLQDFDQDGTVDLYQHSPGQVLILRGRGNGEFRAPRTFPYLGGVPSEIGVVDLDGDGREDILRLRGNGAALDLETGLGDGTGGFSAPMTVTRTPSSSLGRLLTGDFDENGASDVIVQDPAGRRAFVYAGDGRGGFVTYRILDGVGVAELVAGDFDEDGHADLGSGAPDAPGVELRLGDGRGRFWPPVRFVGDGLTSALAVSDFNEDGHLDVARGAEDISTIEVLAGDGAGGLAPAAATMITGSFVARLTPADFDGDGHVDLAAATRDASKTLEQRLLVWHGIGDGTFGEPEALSVPGSPIDVITGDFDENGRADLACVRQPNRYVADIVVFASDRRGGFAPPAGFGSGGVQSYSRIVPADFDADGQTDFAISTSYGQTTPILLGATRDPISTRWGSVNMGLGPRVDVLFVNGSAGTRIERVVAIDRGASLEVSMTAPPSRFAGPSPFVLYGWAGREPSESTVRVLPFGLGSASLPMPFGPSPTPVPREVWNNVGKEAVLGAPTRPSLAAPTRLVLLPTGLGRPAVATLQGVIRDRGARNGIASVTNAIVLRVF